MYQLTDFRDGAVVFTSEGERLGTVSAVWPRYLHVATGFLDLGGDLFIPLDEVATQDADGIHLRASRREIDITGWSNQPVENAGPVEMGQSAIRTDSPTVVGESRSVAPPVTERYAGHVLCDASGAEIGRIYADRVGYAHVRSGLFGVGLELYVPTAAITHCDADRCYLAIAADQVATMEWHRMPKDWPSEWAPRGGPVGIQEDRTHPMPSHTEAFTPSAQLEITERDALKPHLERTGSRLAEVGQYAPPMAVDVVEERDPTVYPAPRDETAWERSVERDGKTERS